MYKEHISFWGFAVGFIRSPYPIYMLLLFLFITIPACSTQFDVYTNNGDYYSIFGFLNASADTQYIRVEELRDSMPRSTPVHLNVVVKLTDLTSNKSAILHDSLFQFQQSPVHNFYTTEKIMPLHSYKLVVNGPGGAESSASITMPDTFPKPVPETFIPSNFQLFCAGVENDYDGIRIKGISKLVSLKAIYYSKSSNWIVNHLADTTRPSPGLIIGRIYYYTDLCQVRPDFLQRIDVVVAAGDPDWPNTLGLDPETEAIPTVATNIKTVSVFWAAS